MMRKGPKTDLSARPNVALPSMVQYKERLFVKHDKPGSYARLEHATKRVWRVDYDLAYDGGGASFSQFYRTRPGAIFSAFFHMYFRSWGGTAELVHQPTERALIPPPPPKPYRKEAYTQRMRGKRD